MLVDILSQLFPVQLHTQDGLRQFQLTIGGFVVVYGLLHLSLYMDNMVHHAYFAIEAGTVLLYLICPADYGLRPVALLKRRLYYLLGTVGFWLAQPHLLPLDPRTSLLLDKRDELAGRIGHFMKQREIERILKAGGQVDEAFLEQGFYAPQMAMAMKALGWMSIILAGLMAVEATFVAVKYSQLKAVEQSSAAAEEEKENEKQQQEATQASTRSRQTSTKATKRR
ncbi:MAG: hypothetical protein J3Q66DRAFT_347305 [Benniella sp.]|nr:MAG: hypothetical protein J3Q66DRAFT_347305 [Benniella sp.]